MTDARRALPSVSALLESEGVRPLLTRAPRGVVVDAIRRAIDAARSAPESAPRSEGDWANAVATSVEQSLRPSLRRIINGTGVVLHTNLGRAPLPQAATDAIARVAAGFSNLEFDIATAAMGHLIVATPNMKVEEWPGDIHGPAYYETRIVKEPLSIKGPITTITDRPGLGVEVDWQLVRELGID